MQKVTFFFVLLFFLTSQVMAQPGKGDVIQQYYQNDGAKILQEYRELLQIPNVSTSLSNIRRNADWIVAAFKERGVDMELLELPEYPEAPPVIFEN